MSITGRDVGTSQRREYADTTRLAIVDATLTRIEQLDDPVAIIRLVAATCRTMREQYGDVIRIMRDTAPHDRAVAATLIAATGRYRQALVPIAQRLLALETLRDGIELDEAVDVLWFYFG